MNKQPNEEALQLLVKSAGIYDQLGQLHKDRHLAKAGLYSEIARTLYILEEKIKREEKRIRNLDSEGIK